VQLSELFEAKVKEYQGKVEGINSEKRGLIADN
jgi:hypothetical protein